MKIAFATDDGVHVDSHFGWAKQIAIYEVEPESSQLFTNVKFTGDLKEDGNEDKLEPKLEAIKDCAILYVSAIGGSGAARVVAKNIHPVKVAETETIENILMQLRKVLSGNPPPWLRKALNKGRVRELDFENEVVHG
jgi:nitrogen fixation protein NifX